MTLRLHPWVGWGEDNLALIMTYIPISLVGKSPSHGHCLLRVGPGCTICFQVLLLSSLLVFPHTSKDSKAVPQISEDMGTEGRSKSLESLKVSLPLVFQLCKRYPGFMRVALSEPQPERR